MRIRRSLLAVPALGLALMLFGPSTAEACHKNPCAPTVKTCKLRTPKVKHCGFKMPKFKMPKLGCHKKKAACPPVVYQQPCAPTSYGAPVSYGAPAPTATYPSAQGPVRHPLRDAPGARGRHAGP